MFGMLEGQTRRGRPRMVGQHQGMVREEVHQLNRKVQDRGTWSMVKTALDTYGHRARGAIGGILVFVAHSSQ